MTIEEAHKELDKQYQRAGKNEYVNMPVAWALYQTWKIADEDRAKEERKSE
jgi:hypothetical protein